MVIARLPTDEGRAVIAAFAALREEPAPISQEHHAVNEGPPEGAAQLIAVPAQAEASEEAAATVAKSAEASREPVVTVAKSVEASEHRAAVIDGAPATYQAYAVVIAVPAATCEGFPAPVTKPAVPATSQESAVLIVGCGVLGLAIEPAVMLAAVSGRGAEGDNPGAETRSVEVAVGSCPFVRAGM